MSSEQTSHGPLPAWPKELFAITLFEEDLEAAKTFYAEAFGLPIIFEDANSCVFKIGTVLINLLRISQADELVQPARVAGADCGTRQVMTIPVEDVDTLCAQLTAHGVMLINGPMNRPWGPRTASFADPGGHIWEIAH